MISNKEFIRICEQLPAFPIRVPMPKRVETILQAVYDVHGTDWDFSEDCRDRKRLVKRVMDVHQELCKSGNEEQLELWKEKAFVNLVAEQAELLDETLTAEPTNEKEKRGRPKKRLSDEVCAKTEEKILMPVVQELENIAEEQGISNPDLLKKLNAICEKKWIDKRESESTEISCEAACGLIYNNEFSVNQYQELRLFFLKFGVKLPTRNDVDSYKKALLPHHETEEAKVTSTLTNVVEQTISSLLELHSSDCDSIEEGAVISINSKIGLDGSGGHQIRHQTAKVEGTEDEKVDSSYVAAFWCPLEIKVLNNS